MDYREFSGVGFIKKLLGLGYDTRIHSLVSRTGQVGEGSFVG